MNSYDTSTLSELVLETKDGDWGQESPNEGYAPYRVIRGADFPLARREDVSAIPLRYLTQRTVERRTLQPNDLIIETAGGSRDRSTGRTLFVTESLLERIGGPATCASFARFLRIDNRKADPRFIYWYLQNLHALGAMWEHQVQHTGVARFQYTRFASTHRIPLPARQVQEAIAEVLSALDDKIAVNDHISETYEQLLRSSFEQLRIDEEPEPSSVITATEIVEFNPTIPVSRRGDAVYLDMSAVPIDRATVLEWSRREIKPGTRFANDDTVMARITPCLENGKTAFIDFMEPGEVGIGSTEFIVMRARPGIPVHVPYFLARSPRFRTYAIQNMVGSSGRQRVNAGQLADFLLRRPDSSNVSTFGSVASKAFTHMRSVADESRNLAELRDVLLPKLMSGEIRVRDGEKVVEDVT